MEKDFFVFRHGQTDWNQKKIFQGRTDIPLNENGRQQALDLRAVVQGLRIEELLVLGW